MRKLIVAVALLLGLIFIFARRSELQAIWETLQNGDLRFLLIALLVQGVWLFNVAASYRVIYRLLGIEEKMERLLVLSAAANFVNVVAPSVGMGGVAIFISEARRREYSSARVTVAGVLYVLFEYVGFLCVLSLGLLVLFRRNHLTTAEIVASSILVLVALGLALMLYLGMHSGEELGRLLAALARLVNALMRPFIHRDYLSQDRAHTFAHDAACGLRELRMERANLAVPVLLSLSNKSLLVLVLFLVFLAFQVPFSIGTLIAGFSIGYLFMIVSPTPAGIGVVEGALTLGLNSLQVPLGAAAVLALVYRGVTFWIPMLFGMVAFRWLSEGEAVQGEV